MKTIKDHRRHKRHSVILKVDYRDVDKFFTDFAENLSKGGMFISTPRPLKPGTSIVLEFSLPDSSIKVKTRGEVIWVRSKPKSPKEKRGMGIKFQELAPKDKEKIDKLILRLKQGPF